MISADNRDHGSFLKRFYELITFRTPKSCAPARWLCQLDGPPRQLISRSSMVDSPRVWDKIHAQAEVAELADALRSGRSEGSLMWVQVPPSAHSRRRWPSWLGVGNTECEGAVVRRILRFRELPPNWCRGPAGFCRSGHGAWAELRRRLAGFGSDPSCSCPAMRIVPRQAGGIIAYCQLVLHLTRHEVNPAVVFVSFYAPSRKPHGHRNRSATSILTPRCGRRTSTTP